MSAQLRLAMLLAALVAFPVRSVADTASPMPTELLPVLQAYLADPAANRQALHRLAADRRGDLPPLFVMLLADLRLRQGNRRAAAKLFQEASGRAQDPHTAAMAEVALGWIAIADGDTPAARVRFDRLADGSTSMRALARFMRAFIAATQGHLASALRDFDDLAADTTASLALRQAAMLGAAYADYWAGSYDAALARFTRARSHLENSPLLDDARFGAAMARASLGEREQADAELRSLAAMASGPTTSRKRASLLVSPDRRTVLRAGMARYRRLPIRAPEEQVIGMIDQDGPSLARAGLRKLDAMVAVAARSAQPHSRRLASIGDGATGDVRYAAPTRRSIAGAAPARPASRSWWLVAVMSVLLVAVLYSRRRTTRPNGS